MEGFGNLSNALGKKTAKPTNDQLTIGIVIDNNDPQQMGRLRVYCPAFGDKETLTVENMPWAMHVSPLAGMTNYGTRGHTEAEVQGAVAYGMWNVPKVDAYVLVGCVDGDTKVRFWIGCIHPQYLTHTMPHGRYTWADSSSGAPDGPLDTIEEKIEPLYSALEEQFTQSGTKYPTNTPSDPKRNMEWRSRGVDTQVSALYTVHINHPEDAPGSSIVDHDPANFSLTSVTQEDGSILEIDGQGYAVSTLEPDAEPIITGGHNFDSHVYSWVTPGFHGFSMDDRPWNSRIRIRTTSGHQIILDDTNERIYINTSEGKTWIELDKVGNIDVHANQNVSVHAGGDINYTTEKSFRVHAKEGIHMYTDDEFRVHAKKDANIHTAQNFRTHSLQETRIESEQDMYVWGHATGYVQFDSTLHLDVGDNAFVKAGSNIHVKAGSSLYLSSGADLHVNAGASGYYTSGSSTHIKSGSTMLLTGGSDIHLNGPAASAATTATDAQESDKAHEKQAFWTSRVPQHEPWGRMFMKKEGPEGADNNGPFAESKTDPNVHVLEYPYTSLEVNKGSQVRGYTYTRNQYWRR